MMKDFLEMRNNAQAYEVFFGKCVREVVGKKKFDELLKCVERGSDLATPTDEAFALLVLKTMKTCGWTC